MTARCFAARAVVLVLFSTVASMAGAATPTIFVSSASDLSGDASSWLPPPGGPTGLAAADAYCALLATGFAGSAQYVAWLSDDDDDAYCRVQGLTGKRALGCGPALQATLATWPEGVAEPTAAAAGAAGPWIRGDGALFARSIDELVAALGSGSEVSGEVLVPALLDEGGGVASASATAWSGTTNTGESSGASCGGWTDTGGFTSIGLLDRTSKAWSAGLGGESCLNAHRVICVKRGVHPEPSTVANPGALVFVTSTSGIGALGSWQPDAGLAAGTEAGDAVCRARAAAGGLPFASTFKAWLGTGAQSASARLTGNGPWVRLDRVKIAVSKAAIGGSPSIFSSIHLDEEGTARHEVDVWTGATNAGGLAAAVCDDWTSVGGHDGLYGHSSTAVAWSDTAQKSCAATAHLYCFQDATGFVFADSLERKAGLDAWTHAVP